MKSRLLLPRASGRCDTDNVIVAWCSGFECSQITFCWRKYNCEFVQDFGLRVSLKYHDLGGFSCISMQGWYTPLQIDLHSVLGRYIPQNWLLHSVLGWYIPLQIDLHNVQAVTIAAGEGDSKVSSNEQFEKRDLNEQVMNSFVQKLNMLLFIHLWRQSKG